MLLSERVIFSRKAIKPFGRYFFYRDIIKIVGSPVPFNPFGLFVEVINIPFLKRVEKNKVGIYVAGGNNVLPCSQPVGNLMCGM